MHVLKGTRLIDGYKGRP